MKSVESGTMISLPAVLSRMKNDLTVLSLYESGELTDSFLTSQLCKLDLGCLVVEDAGVLFFLQLAATGPLHGAMVNPVVNSVVNPVVTVTNPTVNPTVNPVVNPTVNPAVNAVANMTELRRMLQGSGRVVLWPSGRWAMG